MRSFTAALGLCHIGFADADVDTLLQCRRSVELMILQDGSESFVDLNGEMSKNAQELVSRLTTKVGSVKTSMASFVDKPVPFRGVGLGRGNLAKIDYCYDNSGSSALSENYEDLNRAYSAVYNGFGEGGDYPENPYEAMIYAALDPKIGWTAPEVDRDEAGNDIVRVLLTITDDLPHYAGDANAGIEKWNPVPGNPLYPHFFNKNFPSQGAIYRGNTETYARLMALHEKPELTTSEVDEYNKLLELLGPAYYNTLPAHPATFAASEACEKYEYPSLDQVHTVLSSKKIFPVVILSDMSLTSSGKNACKKRGYNPAPASNEDWVACLEGVYSQDLQDAGFDKFLITKFHTDADQLIANIVETVDRISRDITCPEPTVQPPTVQPTAQPTAQTTLQPTARTTLQPTAQTTLQPTAQPSSYPYSARTTYPSTAAPLTGAASTEAAPTAAVSSPEVSSSEAAALSSPDASSRAIISSEATATGAPGSSTGNYPIILPSASPDFTTGEGSGSRPATASADAPATAPAATASADDDTPRTTKGSQSGDDATTNAAGSVGSESTDSWTTSTEEEQDAHILPPAAAPSSSGSKKTATIAGAAGGAVAGAAAVAGLLYKRFGMGMFGKTSTPDMPNVEQVDVPDTPVEREAYEEVTMDMFQ